MEDDHEQRQYLLRPPLMTAESMTFFEGTTRYWASGNGGFNWLFLFEGVVFAEAQVQMADPPSTVEQTVSAQPAPATAAPAATAQGAQQRGARRNQ